MSTLSLDLGSLVITTGYLATAAAVVRRRTPLLRGCGAFLVLLAVERQLSLGARLGGELRSAARDVGWYDDRFAIQVAATMIVVAVAIAASFTLVRRAGRDLMVVAGVGALTAFGAVRMLSLHSLDQVFSRQTSGIRSGVAIELAILAFTAVVARHATKRHTAVSIADSA